MKIITNTGISDLFRMAIVYFVIIHYKSCKLIFTESFFKEVTIRCEIVVDLALEGGRQQNHETSPRFWLHFDQKVKIRMKPNQGHQL